MSNKRYHYSVCSVRDCFFRMTPRSIHHFPNAKKHPLAFKIWLSRIANPKFDTWTVKSICDNAKVCDMHFSKHCRVPGWVRLKTGSLPTLHVPGYHGEPDEVNSCLDVLEKTTDNLAPGFLNSAFQETLVITETEFDQRPDMNINIEINQPEFHHNNYVQAVDNVAASEPDNRMFQSVKSYLQDGQSITEVCRVCFRAIIGTQMIRLQDDSTESAQKVKEMLTSVLPELDLDIYPKAVICMRCSNLLTFSAELKEIYKSTENKLNKLVNDRKNYREKDADLVILAEATTKYDRQESLRFTFEVDDGNGELNEHNYAVKSSPVITDDILKNILTLTDSTNRQQEEDKKKSEKRSKEEDENKSGKCSCKNMNKENNNITDQIKEKIIYVQVPARNIDTKVLVNEDEKNDKKTPTEKIVYVQVPARNIETKVLGNEDEKNDKKTPTEKIIYVQVPARNIDTKVLGNEDEKNDKKTPTEKIIYVQVPARNIDTKVLGNEDEKNDKKTPTEKIVYVQVPARNIETKVLGNEDEKNDKKTPTEKIVYVQVPARNIETKVLGNEDEKNDKKTPTEKIVYVQVPVLVNEDGKNDKKTPTEKIVYVQVPVLVNEDEKNDKKTPTEKIIYVQVPVLVNEDEKNDKKTRTERINVDTVRPPTNFPVCWGSGPFICEICGFQCTDISVLKKHLSLERQNKYQEIKCEQCGKVSNSRAEFRNHKRHHLKNKPTMCETCGKILTTRHSYLQHHQRHLLKETKTVAPPKTYKCVICDRIFKQRFILRRHVKGVHLKIIDYHCEICGRGFTSAVNLRHHRQTHNPEGKYSCKICHKKFKQPTSLSKHRHKHDVGRMFKCELCDRKMKWATSFKRHMQIYHVDGWKFTCEVCRKRYWKKVDLDKHRLQRHDILS